MEGSSGFRDCERTPGGMSGGISGCVRVVMQTIRDFQHMNVSYKKKK